MKKIIEISSDERIELLTAVCLQIDEIQECLKIRKSKEDSPARTSSIRFYEKKLVVLFSLKDRLELL